MTKIVIFILACTTCDLTKITYPFNNDKYVFCGDMANDIRTNMATYKEEAGQHTTHNYLWHCQ